MATNLAEYHFHYGKHTHNHTVTMRDSAPGEIYVFESEQVKARIHGLPVDGVQAVGSDTNWLGIVVKAACLLGFAFLVFWCLGGKIHKALKRRERGNYIPRMDAEEGLLPNKS